MEDIDNGSKEVPFDMVRETLKAIRLWIDKISELSIGLVGVQRINMNDMIVAKYKMIEQLIVLSSPLLKEKDLEEIEAFFSSINIKIGDSNDGTGWKRNSPIYSRGVDIELNECVKGIEEGLKKYFVPTINKGEKY